MKSCDTCEESSADKGMNGLVSDEYSPHIFAEAGDRRRERGNRGHGNCRSRECGTVATTAGELRITRIRANLFYGETNLIGS